MTIGIDVRNLYAPAMKGIGVYVQNLLPELAALDRSTEFVLFYDSRQAFTRRLPSGTAFRDRGISVRKGDTFYAWEQFRLPLEVRRESVNIFHSPANTTPLWKPAPTVVTVHDVKLLEIPGEGARFRLYHRRVQKLAISRADAVICPSEFTRREVLNSFPVDPDRVTVIHNGVGQQFHVIADRAQVEVVCKTFAIEREFVLFAGGESAPKNISALLAAFASVHGRHADLLLVVPGIRTAAILEKHRAEARRLRIENSVLFPGYVGESDLVALMNAARMLVYPSLSEGFGLPPLEAMACGTPVAASNATSIPEVVGDAAILFDPTSTAAIADAIERLLADAELCEDLRRKGFRRAAQFSWRRAAEATLGLYYEAARRTTSTARGERAVTANH